MYKRDKYSFQQLCVNPKLYVESYSESSANQ
jgi:hypothetical protein